MEEMNDEKLIAVYKAGDETAFQALVLRYTDPIYRFVHRYAGIIGDAEDLTQDVFVKVWKHIKTFDENRKFKTWIFAIAKNTALNWVLKKKPILFSEYEEDMERTLLIESLQDQAPSLEESFAMREQHYELALALQRLNANDRSLLNLYYQRGFNFREIAEQLKTSLHTIKSRHRRALITLKKILKV